MPPIDPDAPWWVNSLLILAAIYGTHWLAGRSTRKKVAAIESQTVNEHHQDEYPNLRDELTATRRSVESVGRDVGGMREEMRTERRERIAVSDRLDEHLSDVPRLTADAVSRGESDHIAACPLRTPKEPS